MIRMKDVAEIHRAFGLGRRLRAIDHVKEIGCFTERVIRMNQRQSLAMALKIGRADRDLGN